VGDEIILRNVAPEEETTQLDVPQAELPAPQPRKTYRPLGDNVLVRRAEDPTKSFSDMKTAQAADVPGVVLIQDAVNQDAPAEGVVLKVGNDVLNITQGDTVSFGKYSGAQLADDLAKKLGGGTLLLMRESEILGIIEDEAEITEETFDYQTSGIIGRA
jgi:co-chaperonin GroES (HSP10)